MHNVQSYSIQDSIEEDRVHPERFIPGTQDPLRRAGLEILIATFLALSLLFFFASFFDAFLGRSWLRFPSQLASQNRPKSKKNRYQDAIHLGLRFFIDFYRFLLPTSTPQSQLNASRLAFSWFWAFKVDIDF